MTSTPADGTIWWSSPTATVGLVVTAVQAGIDLEWLPAQHPPASTIKSDVTATTTDGPPTMPAPPRQLPFLRPRDLATMWGVKVTTVYRYMAYSSTGRYEDNPIPPWEYLTPASDKRGPQQPVWFPDKGETLNGLRTRLRAWWKTHRKDQRKAAPPAGGAQ